jgi:serine/threonine protein kinase/pimeloyl-ACP methyl ester carboxylesterase/tetratricopeptide (TPR) repeat protein
MDPNEQQIRFRTSSDGVSIAFATVGTGPPLVKTANWLSHLEFDWNSPVWRHWITELSRYHTFIRYDERGCGLSDWNVNEFSLESWVCDLEAVVDAQDLDRFPLLGISQGGPIAVAYASRHPERVSQLVLYGSYAAGVRMRSLPQKVLEEAELFLQMIKLGWGREHAAFRQVFTSLFIPEATTEQILWFNELQRVSSTPENAARMMSAFYDLDVRELAQKLKVPTLVLHAKGDLRIPFDEGRRLAALIPGSRFVPLESRNHILLKTEPAWQRFLSEVRSFLGVELSEKQSTSGSAHPEKRSGEISESRWKEISALFDQAAGLGTEERNKLLAQVDDSGLRRQVETLLVRAPSASIAPELGELVKGSLVSFNETLDELSGQSISHYRILEKLGEGGMGTIYKARDERLDRFVALKFLPPYFSTKLDLKRRFTREAKAAAALEHSNICTIYEIGQAADGQLFISMPCYEGETLKEKIYRGPLAIDEALDYTVQAADGLAHAHAFGIVHRDVKPANLFVTTRGQVKILDFGIAKTADINLTSAGMLLGTVAYMSPEQASGETLDYRTDMWSLGVVLQEMLTGRHPFASETGDVSLYAIKHENAGTVTALRPDAPAALDGVLERLLAKDAAERYPTFEALVADLRPLQEESVQRYATRELRTPQQTDQKKPAGLLTTVDSSASGAKSKAFVGREQELQRLGALLESACAGAGRIVFVTGEPGMGKTSLVSRFMTQTTERLPGIICLTGHCVEQYGAGEAYLPFLNAFSRSLDGPEKEYVAPMLLSYAPAWSMQFTSAFSATDIREQLRREAMGATQERMLREMCDFLNALATRKPLVLLLEDLHWADPSSINLIRYLGHMIERMPLLVIGTYRPEEIENLNRSLRDCVRELRAHDQSEEIALGVLGNEAIANHLDARFPPNTFSRELATMIEQRTGGHPLFATRLARELAERGDIVRRNSRWELARDISQISLEMPESVMALIRRRIELLNEEDQRLLQYASTQGEEFLSPIVADLLDSDKLEIEERLDRLAKSSHLLRNSGEEELPGGAVATRYRFSHALYQNVLYEDLVSARRRQLHLQTGKLFEALYGDKSAQIASQLAVHFELARDFDRAVRYLVQIGDNAARVYAPVEAIKHFSHAIELVAKLPDGQGAVAAAPIYVKRGAVKLNCGKFDEAIVDFERAVELARENDAYETEHAALNGLVITFFISHRLEEMTRCAEEALKLSERSGNAGLRLETLAYMAQRSSCYGKLNDAKRLNEQIIAEADAANDEAGLSIASLQRGELHLHQGEYAQAVELLEHGVAIALRLGDSFKHMYGLFMLGMAQANLGQISAALATLERLQTIAERNGDRTWLVRCPNTIGWVYREMQDFERAEALDKQNADLTNGSEFQEVLAHSLINLSYDLVHRGATDDSLSALDEALQARDRDVWMQWRHNIRLQAALAEHWLARGDLMRAELYARELLGVATLHSCRKYVVAGHKLLADVAALHGLWNEAEAEYKKAVALLREYPAPLLSWRVHAALGRFLKKKGDITRAQMEFDRAAAVINEIVANIDDDDLLQTFMHSAPIQEVFEHSVERFRTG